MAVILALSSQVARGHVGLSAIVPVLHALGHEVVALPTVLLSNHPGHAHVAGTRIAPDVLERMLDTLDKSGWLAGIDAVLTGYLPSVEHVKIAARAVSVVSGYNPTAIYVCDPVLGDDPKGLYIAQDAAKSILAELLPLADGATPNRFELEWLSGQEVRDVAGAVTAGRSLGPPAVFATSIPAAQRERILNLRVSANSCLSTHVEHRTHVPHGTGDMMSALVLAYMLAGEQEDAQLARAIGALEVVIAASEARDELALVTSRREWLRAHPMPVERL